MSELPGYLVVPNESSGDYEAAESSTAVDNGGPSSSKARSSMDKAKPPPDDEFYDAPPAYAPPTPSPSGASNSGGAGRTYPDPPRRQGWRALFQRRQTSQPASPVPGPSSTQSSRQTTSTAVPAAPPTPLAHRAPHPAPLVDHLRITPSKGGDITVEWILTSSASAFVWPYIPGIAPPPPCACGDGSCVGGLFVPEVWRARKPAEARGRDGTTSTVIRETYFASKMPIIVRGDKLTVSTG